MFFQKIETVKVSERVFDIVNERLFHLLERKAKIGGWYEVFNNCREQGYVLRVTDTDYKKDDLIFWAYRRRNSESIMIVFDTDTEGVNNMFTESAWVRAKGFEKDCYAEAAQYIIDMIKSHFELEE